MSDIITKDQDDISKDISLELSDKTFANLILNFLGKKEKLKFEDKISFVIRLNDIEQFYFLLNDKISKEHSVFIDHFLVSITYNDNTVREISGIESLNKFIETRDVIPKDITLSWNVLIKYPNAKTIENQKIQLTFITNVNDRELGEVILVISHTNQAWGIEVLNLLRNKIIEVSIKPKKIYSIAKKIRNSVNIAESLLSALPIIVLLSFLMSSSLMVGSEFYSKILNVWVQTPNSQEVEMAVFAVRNMQGDDILNFAKTHVNNPELKEALIEISKTKHRGDTFMKMGWLFGSFIGFIVASFLYLKKTITFYGLNSHILVSKRSESTFNDEISNNNKIEYFSISFLLVAIICGALGNFIYQSIAA